MIRFVFIITVLFGIASPVLADGNAPVPAAPRIMTESEIIDAIRAAALDQGFSANSVIKLNKMSRNLISTDKTDEIVIGKLDINRSNSSFLAELSLIRNPAQKSIATGRIAAIINVPVLTSPHNMGDEITDADLTYIDIEQTALGQNAITEASQIVGKTAKRAIQANAVIRTGMVTQPILVKKNTLINLTFHADGMALSYQARAIEDGAMGEAVRVLNTQSNKIIDAVVSGPGSAMVGPNATKNSIASK